MNESIKNLLSLNNKASGSANHLAVMCQQPGFRQIMK